MGTVDQGVSTGETDGSSVRKLERIRALVSGDERRADDVLDAIADVIGEHRSSRPLYQKPLG